MITNFDRTANWLKSCGKEPGVEAHSSVQIGCHLEEFAEFLRTVRVNSEGGRLVIDRTVADLDWLSGKLKSGAYMVHIPPHERTNALDALCDGDVTGNGICYLYKMDKRTADQRVLDANDAKLVDGKPVLLPGGKIGKPEGWKAADLTDLI